MDITIPEGEVVTMMISPKRRVSGRPGVFAGPVEWIGAASGDGTGIVIDVADDLLSAKIHGKVAGTTGAVTLTARTLRGDELSETHRITVTPPAADDFGVSVSEPVADEAA